MHDLSQSFVGKGQQQEVSCPSVISSKFTVQWIINFEHIHIPAEGLWKLLSVYL